METPQPNYGDANSPELYAAPRPFGHSYQGDTAWTNSKFQPPVGDLKGTYAGRCSRTVLAPSGVPDPLQNLLVL